MPFERENSQFEHLLHQMSHKPFETPSNWTLDYTPFGTNKIPVQMKHHYTVSFKLIWNEKLERTSQLNFKTPPFELDLGRDLEQMPQELLRNMPFEMNWNGRP